MKYLRKKKNIAHKILTEIWDILPTELKRIVSPTLFKKKKKKKIRELAPKNCPCRVCKTYEQNIGFL